MAEKKYIEVVWSHGRKKSEECVKKVYLSETEGLRRGRPVVRLKDRVKDYMHKRVANRGGRGV